MKNPDGSYTPVTKEDYNKLVKEGARVVEDADEFFQKAPKPVNLYKDTKPIEKLIDVIQYYKNNTDLRPHINDLVVTK